MKLDLNFFLMVELEQSFYLLRNIQLWGLEILVLRYNLELNVTVWLRLNFVDENWEFSVCFFSYISRS